MREPARERVKRDLLQKQKRDTDTGSSIIASRTLTSLLLQILKLLTSEIFCFCQEPEVERMCGICGMFRAENGGVGAILTTPGACFFPAFFFWYFLACYVPRMEALEASRPQKVPVFFFWYYGNVLRREWRHLDHTKVPGFFCSQATSDRGLGCKSFGHTSVFLRQMLASRCLANICLRKKNIQKLDAF